MWILEANTGDDSWGRIIFFFFFYFWKVFDARECVMFILSRVWSEFGGGLEKSSLRKKMNFWLVGKMLCI